MNKIIFASNNQGKIKEVKASLKQLLPNVEVYSLREMNISEEIEEPGVTFYQNALIKAEYIAKKYPEYIVLADDSGLEVKALNNEPGVYSARFAKDWKEYKTDKNLANNLKLLKMLASVLNRQAQFKTVMCLIVPKQEPIFVSGLVEGMILNDFAGTDGFGYDPLFSIDGTTSFAQLSLEQKNQISHRAKALENLIKHPIWQELC